MERYLGENTPKLGFGLMRLPKLPGGKTDIEQVKKMVDLFMGAGMTYFDTAFVYDKGGSEAAAKEALVDRYPRESFTLATKLNCPMGASNEKDAKQELFTSLERTGAGYIDYYLIHGIGQRNIKYYEDFGIFDFVREQKAAGLIKHWGFSFHDTPEMLDELLTKYPDAEFVQIQLNYADWEAPNVQSRACWEVIRKHNKPVVIMEPVKGGSLATPQAEVQTILKEANPDASFASWAIRYAASLDGILTVLSGMTSIEQMEDNISFMKDFKPLTDEEQEVIKKAQAVLNGNAAVPCTGCSYCTAGCPMQIPIPEIFAARNKDLIWGKTEEAKADFAKAVEGKGKPSDCIECKQCETVCPQHMMITRLLKEQVEYFEK